jgi:leader peptidase (prepilin peptidase) / N-methyltransferase
MDSGIALLFQHIAVFVLGCCLGSFFNVVIYRLPRHESIVRPGSHCPHCMEPIAGYHNIPLVSYLILGGKCSRCKQAISIRYPLIEVISGLLALFLFRRYGWEAQFFIEFFFVSLLVVITFIDLDTLTIPDLFSLTGIVVGFASSFLSPRISWLDSILGILLGGGFFYLIAIAYQYFRHQEGLGGGDIKLLAMIGAFTGLSGAMFTVLVASVVGTLVGLALMWRSRKGLMTMLPFGPFLSFGAVCYLFWGPQFYAWYLSTLVGD